MEIETIITITLAVVVAVIGFLLKDLLKSINLKIERQSGSIKTMLNNSTDFKIDLVRITASLENIKAEQSTAKGDIKDTKATVLSNTQRITEHGHDLAALKLNQAEFTRVVMENDKELIEVKKKLFVIENKK